MGIKPGLSVSDVRLLRLTITIKKATRTSVEAVGNQNWQTSEEKGLHNELKVFHL